VIHASIESPGNTTTRADHLDRDSRAWAAKGFAKAMARARSTIEGMEGREGSSRLEQWEGNGSRVQLNEKQM